MTEETKYVYRLEKVISEGDVPNLLMLTMVEEYEVGDEITLQNSDVLWRVVTKEPTTVFEGEPKFND